MPKNLTKEQLDKQIKEAENCIAEWVRYYGKLIANKVEIANNIGTTPAGKKPKNPPGI